MKELIYFSFQKKYVFLLIFFSSLPLVFIGDFTLSAFIASRFFAYGVVPSYILFVYFRLKDIAKMYNLLLTRIGEKKFYLSLLASSTLTITVYAAYTFVLMFGAYFLIGGEKAEYFPIYALVFLMNLIVFSVIDLVSIFSINSRNKVVGILCLFLFNLFYHYAFIEVLVGNVQ